MSASIVVNLLHTEDLKLCGHLVRAFPWISLLLYMIWDGKPQHKVNSCIQHLVSQVELDFSPHISQLNAHSQVLLLMYSRVIKSSSRCLTAAFSHIDRLTV